MQKIDWVNRLGKWRNVLAGWQLGTRAKGDTEGDAVRDHREATLMQRAELTALTALLLDKRVITIREFKAQVQIEAEVLCAAYEQSLPGFKATDEGIEMNVAAVKTTQGWKP